MTISCLKIVLTSPTPIPTSLACVLTGETGFSANSADGERGCIAKRREVRIYYLHVYILYPQPIKIWPEISKSKPRRPSKIGA